MWAIDARLFSTMRRLNTSLSQAFYNTATWLLISIHMSFIVNLSQHIDSLETVCTPTTPPPPTPLAEYGIYLGIAFLACMVVRELWRSSPQ